MAPALDGGPEPKMGHLGLKSGLVRPDLGLEAVGPLPALLWHAFQAREQPLWPGKALFGNGRKFNGV